MTTWELIHLSFKKIKESAYTNKRIHSDCNILRFATGIATGDLNVGRLAVARLNR
jgi:hypothetical protein